MPLVNIKHAQGVLVALQKLYNDDMIAAMTDLKQGIKSCSSRIEEVRDAFSKVISTSKELELSMTKSTGNSCTPASA